MEKGKKIWGNVNIKLSYCILEITSYARSCMPRDNDPPLTRKLLPKRSRPLQLHSSNIGLCQYRSHIHHLPSS